MDTTTEPVLDAAEVARRLGVGRETVLEMARKGRLPSYRVGKKVLRFRWSEVLDATRQGAGKAPPK